VTRDVSRLCQESGNLHLQEGSKSVMGSPRCKWCTVGRPGREASMFFAALCAALDGLHLSTQVNLPETSEQWKSHKSNT